ncbi:MAG: tetratricopeptide repeat protein [Hydrococcus sp. RU_2_2]|jgi:tetratricopeptide (TPR) repeat protein|nr:tetratricopeptide repeat protein [Hydrococcus sp. RU_2_2]NJP22106.1 tetratricopeptide repeat protein [Hydrococcus sp. CRU_1_1]
MENQQANNSSLSTILDVAAVVGAIGGSVASVVTQQVAFAAIPLSASIVLNVVNRRQMMTQTIATQQATQNAIGHFEQLSQQQISTLQNSVSELSQYQQEYLSQLDRQIQGQQTSFEALSERLGSVSEQVADLQKSSANLTKETQQLQEDTQSLQSHHQEMEAIVMQIREMQEISQKMVNNPNSAEFYFNRGLSHERIGDKNRAIDDYASAIRLDPNFAPAYHHRGILSNEIGHRKKAIDDLRKASQLYFGQGDIENYEVTKELSKNLYELRSPGMKGQEKVKTLSSNTLLVGGLFS